MMLAALVQTMSASAGLAPDEQQRIGVYVLAGIVGILVAGVIACAKEWRRDRAEARLRRARDAELAARDALAKLARDMKAA